MVSAPFITYDTVIVKVESDRESLNRNVMDDSVVRYL